MTTRPAAAGQTADRLAPFGATIFAEMTRLANEHGAVNLSQGFPDFDGPGFMKHAAAEAMQAGRNQYARPMGEPALNEAIAAAWRARTGVEIDPTANVTVTAGCTEALASAFLGLVNPGDEVILFEPYYDSYRACVAMAGGTARLVTLRPDFDRGAFVFEESDLRAAFTPRTRAILVNTPHNPTGKVFSRAELELIARLCVEHDVLAITDEVYERLVYEPDQPHLCLAALPGMAERTLTLSSTGKTFSMTGWKIGWGIGPPPLTAALRAAHQFITFAVATPLQYGAAAAVRPGGEGEAYVAALLEQYRAARDFLGEALDEIGFRTIRPAGAYFIMADHTPFGFEDDVAFCRHLTTQVGVAAIPPSAFYADRDLGGSFVRFAFCKRRETLEEAVRRMRARLR